MRPWMIALASCVGALVAAIALARPELSASPPFVVLPAELLPQAAAAGVAGIAAYAFAAMLWSTATLIVSCLATRRRLARLAANRATPEYDWIEAFGAIGLRRLLVPLVAPSSGRSAIVLSRRFSPREARREIGRLHYIWLARTHFFSALVILAGIAVLGFVQDQRPVPLLTVPLPTIAVAVELAAAALFALLGRLAVDIAAEPLLEALSRLPVEPSEVGLLRRTVELLEYGRGTLPAPTERPPSAGRQVAEQLVAAIEEGQHALLESISDLASRTGAAWPTIEEGQRALIESIADLSVRTGMIGPAIEAAIATLDGSIRALSARSAPLGELSVPADAIGPAIEEGQRALIVSVSYTHLTLPTICSV